MLKAPLCKESWREPASEGLFLQFLKSLRHGCAAPPPIAPDEDLSCFYFFDKLEVLHFATSPFLYTFAPPPCDAERSGDIFLVLHLRILGDLYIQLIRLFLERCAAGDGGVLVLAPEVVRLKENISLANSLRQLP